MLNSFFSDFKEKFFKQFFVVQDRLKSLLKWLTPVCNVVLVIAAMLFFTLLIIRVGFSNQELLHTNTYYILKTLFISVYFAKYIEEFTYYATKKRWAKLIDLFLFAVNTLFLVLLLRNNVQNPLYKIPWLGYNHVIGVLLTLTFISEGYKVFRIIDTIRVSPSLLFALSFLLLIFIGSGLLLLPDAHSQPLSYLDALFTSVSAVCVTGLVVVDTSAAFTQTGQFILMTLIQIGGLGIMTFTGFFAFAFTGSVSFKDRILLKSIFSAETLGDIFRMLFKILVFTLLIELLGAAIIYFNVDENIANPLFFSVFHSVSAFCNAGFSIIEGGLASKLLQSRTGIFLIIGFLVILGGIGFPVLLHLYEKFSRKISHLIKKSYGTKSLSENSAVKIASKIIIVTTLILLFSGTLGYYLIEKNNSMQGMGEPRKWLVSLFGSISARTAGFNMVDMTKWNPATVFMMIVLMWIGASPGSTGGGIKTTTIAIAFMAAYHFIRGHNRIEINYRQIGNKTISRVLIVIVLSIVLIAGGFFVLLISEPDKNPLYLLFETVSAFSTVGLSLANTATLSVLGKTVIMMLMFVGRVGPLTLLSGIFVSHKKDYYRYPKQDLVIN